MNFGRCGIKRRPGLDWNVGLAAGDGGRDEAACGEGARILGCTFRIGFGSVP